MSAETIARSIVQTLTDGGFIAYFAGGWVRDHLLGISCSDIDIATDATPTSVMRLFSKTVPVGVAFGSVIVVESGHSFEVTTFRSESGYADGRHPDQITFSDPETDAKRRGLTINGMFYDPIRDMIIDLVGGQQDLQAKLVRAIGNPQNRFNEDKLRMIRAIRFATRFGFTIEPETAKAITAHASNLFPSVAIERVWQEFDKIHAHPSFGKFLLEMERFGLLGTIFPEYEGDIEAALAPLVNYPNKTPLILQLMQLFRSLSMEERTQIGMRLKVSRKDLTRIRQQAKLQSLLANAHATTTQWVHFYSSPEARLYLTIEAAQTQDPESFLKAHVRHQEILASHIHRIRTGQPLVTAAHLRKLGIEPGKKMGNLLRQAEQLAIECDLQTPNEVLELLNFQ